MVVLAGATAAGESLDAFGRLWWLILAGGLATSALVAPMRTGGRSATAGPAPAH